MNNGSVADAATATGTPPTGPTVTSPSSPLTVPATSLPALTVVKSSTPTTVTAAGQTITYTFAVKNTGNVSLTNVLVNDTQTAPAGSLTSGPTCPGGTLAPAASQICTATYIVTQADMNNGSVADAATATGTPPTGPSVTSPSSPLTVPATSLPALTVVKSSTPTTVTAAGQTITYTFAVKNTGNVTLSTITINDTQTAPAGSLTSGPTCPGGSLAPGSTTDCTATYIVTQADMNNGSVADAATATGTPPTGPSINSAQANLSVPATQTPSLTVVKSATPSTVSSVGTVVIYTFDVTNTGNVSLTAISINDTQTNPVGDTLTSGPTCPSGSLAPGASVDCTATATVTQADLDNGSISDSATATGTPPSGPPITTPNPGTTTVTVTQSPALTVVKSATPKTVSTVGTIVTYTFDVTNTGNVSLTAISMNDTQTNPVGDTLTSGPTCPGGTLAPGASVDCTATATVTQADLDNGSISDSATATGTPPSSPPVTTPNPGTTTVTVTQSPALTIVKTATPTTVSSVGTVVTYTFDVTNTGNVTLKTISVNDTQTSPVGGTLTSGPTCPSGSLAPSASVDCFATAKVTQADLDNGSISDSATATGTPPSGPPITTPNPGTTTVTVTQAPGLTIVKTATPSVISKVGQIVTYRFVVKNTGDVDVTNVKVNDTQIAPVGSQLTSGPTCPSGSLAPGNSLVCTATAKVTQADLDSGSISDSATATGTPPSGPPFTTPKPSTLIVKADQRPLISIVTMAGVAYYSKSGEVIPYTFVVTNTGNVTLGDVSVASSLIGLSAISCPAIRLAPGQAMTCTATYKTTKANLAAGSVVNNATASGTPPPGGRVKSDPSGVVVPAIRPKVPVTG
jgi:uncharacterized repeat protein (TIGR01451 family)